MSFSSLSESWYTFKHTCAEEDTYYRLPRQAQIDRSTTPHTMHTSPWLPSHMIVSRLSSLRHLFIVHKLPANMERVCEASMLKQAHHIFCYLLFKRQLAGTKVSYCGWHQGRCKALQCLLTCLVIAQAVTSHLLSMGHHPPQEGAPPRGLARPAICLPDKSPLC